MNREHQTLAELRRNFIATAAVLAVVTFGAMSMSIEVVLR
jgi:hypothetical protein